MKIIWNYWIKSYLLLTRQFEVVSLDNSRIGAIYRYSVLLLFIIVIHTEQIANYMRQQPRTYLSSAREAARVSFRRRVKHRVLLYSFRRERRGGSRLCNLQTPMDGHLMPHVADRSRAPWAVAVADRWRGGISPSPNHRSRPVCSTVMQYIWLNRELNLIIP